MTHIEKASAATVCALLEVMLRSDTNGRLRRIRSTLEHAVKREHVRRWNRAAAGGGVDEVRRHLLVPLLELHLERLAVAPELRGGLPGASPSAYSLLMMWFSEDATACRAQ